MVIIAKIRTQNTWLIFSKSGDICYTAAKELATPIGYTVEDAVEAVEALTKDIETEPPIPLELDIQ